jgi:hypothetical protein
MGKKDSQVTIKTTKRHSGMFKPGNKMALGRPTGSQNRITLMLEKIGEDASKECMEKMVELGLQGDVVALKFVLERILQPPRRGYRITLPMPAIESMDDVGEAMKILIASMAAGYISFEESNIGMSSLEKKMKFIETQDLVPRVERMEAAMKTYMKGGIHVQ